MEVKDSHIELINRLYDYERQNPQNSGLLPDEIADKTLRNAFETTASGAGNPKSRLAYGYTDLLGRQIKKENEYVGGQNSEYYDDYSKKVLGSKESVMAPKEFSDYKAYYDPNTQKISMDTDFSTERGLGVFAHELGHKIEDVPEYNWIRKPQMGTYTEGLPSERGGYEKTLTDFLNARSGSDLKSIELPDGSFKHPSLAEFDAARNKLSESQMYELLNYRHFSAPELSVDKMVGGVRLPELPYTPLEKQLIIARMVKNGALKALPAISSVSALPGAVVDYVEAAKDPNITDDEKLLRGMNAVYPNEQMQSDIDAKKRLRDYQHI